MEGINKVCMSFSTSMNKRRVRAVPKDMLCVLLSGAAPGTCGVVNDACVEYHRRGASSAGGNMPKSTSVRR